jgi:LCP family protein required for cell wall assembly
LCYNSVALNRSEEVDLSQRRRRKDNSLGWRIAAGVLGIIFVCGSFFFGYQIYDTVRTAVVILGLPDLEDVPSISIGPQPAKADVPNIAAGERVNVLVMGMDKRPSEKCPCRTDTMMIATLDPKTSTAGLVTLPRDLYVPIPGVGDGRINQANFYGALYKYPGGGPALAKKTVEYNFGRRIHYYVLVDFEGFRKVVDTLGGIDIDVPKAIYDPQYPDENYGFRPVQIPAGRVHMNGDMALVYARVRHTDSDFGRSRRQIQVLLAIRDKALRLDLLPKVPSLLQSMWGTIETDMSPQEVLALAVSASKVKTENIKTATIDQTMTVEFVTAQGAAVLWPDRAKIGQLLEQIIPSDSLADLAAQVKKEGARVLVLNGTSNAQLAERTAKYLQAQGYVINAYGNADRFDYTKTVLVDYSGVKSGTITAMAKLFRVDPANIRRVTNVKSDEDIRIIVGSDWSLPAEK